MKRKRLGEVLQERGQISSSNLAQAVAAQEGKIVLLGELLLERELVTKAELISALEEVTHIPYLDCAAVSPDRALLRRIPQSLARKCVAFPVAMQGSKILVVMAEPQNLAMLDEVKFTAGLPISPRLGFREEILQAITKHYAGLESAQEAEDHENDSSGIEFISTSSRQANREAIQEAQAELGKRTTPAVKIVSEAIKMAVMKRASDIHVEPQAKDVLIRMRVDGVLRDLRREPRSIQNTLISRIKILADMDIAERRVPQDGRFMVRMGATSIDLRISTLPTQYGEKVVMRLLNSSSGLMNISDLTMHPDVERIVRRVLMQPQGTLLVTGPTGSGKSTTLYAALNHIRQPAVNIVTVEDPVEYVLPGINQVHVNNKAGLSFATCLRSVLRQDPNVIMIGEIRDAETAEIALKAAQTGHLVLSTLHTNDSIAAVTRLLDLGIANFLIASSVTAILAQRLVRRLCDCRKQARVSPEASEHLAQLGLGRPMDTIYVPVGCDLCDQTGYRGRIGLYEVLEFDETTREAVRRGESGEEIRAARLRMGMRFMQDDALDKIVQGVTSLEEVLRVVPSYSFSPSARCSGCAGKIVPTFHFCPNCGVKQKTTNAPAAKQSAKLSVEELAKS